MLKIAHRGNIAGPSNLENSLGHIDSALSQGYDVEVDVWLVEGKFFFGHDEPTYGEITEAYLLEISDHAWFHCKNLAALEFFSSNPKEFKYFWHQKDDYCLTSNNYIWTYPEKATTSRCIIVSTVPGMPQGEYYGVCSDYVSLL